MYPEFDKENEYIFYGTVIGYTKKYSIRGVENNFYGIRILVTDLIYGKQKVKELVIFPFKFTNLCSPLGIGIEYLKEKYPQGTNIRGTGIKHYSVRIPEGEILQIESYPYFDLSRVDESQFLIKKGYKELYNLEKDLIDNKNYVEAKKYRNIAKFKIRIDLSRIANSNKKRKKKKIIRELKYSIYFPPSLRNYLDDEDWIVKFYKRRQKIREKRNS
jgi:hypothetical protein